MHRQNLAKFTFYYLLALVTLIMTAMAVGNVIFELINKFIPDPLVAFSAAVDSNSIKVGIATLIIASPVYFWTSYQILKSLANNSLDREAAPRRWLTYLIILISSLVMVGWLIGTLFNFLDGEFTLRFALKALTSLIIAGGIFGFYFYDVRREKVEKADKIVKYSGFAAIALVLISLITSFFFVESPTAARDRRHDQNIISNFEQIDSSLNSFYAENKKLPVSLEFLVNEKRYLSDSVIKDPATNQIFSYKILAAKKYQLCATFLASNIGANPNVDYTVTRWPHDKGNQCISQQIFLSDTVPASVDTLKNGPSVPVK